MTNEEKQLLLRDLCGRLPYGVKIKHFNTRVPKEILNIDSNGLITAIRKRTEDNGGDIVFKPCEVEKVKPYLRPMSSMTNKERRFLLKFGSVGMDENDKVFDVYPFGLERTMSVIDFLNTYHFDYRGLIEKGLALEAPEEMY